MGAILISLQLRQSLVPQIREEETLMVPWQFYVKSSILTLDAQADVLCHQSWAAALKH